MCPAVFVSLNRYNLMWSSILTFAGGIIVVGWDPWVTAMFEKVQSDGPSLFTCCHGSQNFMLHQPAHLYWLCLSATPV